MARGAYAKDNLMNKFIQDNKTNYIGCYDKKYYFWADDNGERVQIAVSMTCPKTPVATTGTDMNGELNFDEDAIKSAVATSFEPMEITQEEKDNVKMLMEKLGL